MQDLINYIVNNNLGNYYTNYDLNKKNTIKSNAIASFVFEPNSVKSLSLFVKYYKEDVIIIGNGSNVVINETNIVDKVIIFLTKLNHIIFDKNKSVVKVGAGVKSGVLYKHTTVNEYNNLNFLRGIPGTIGGNIYMNAGCYGHSVSDYLESVKVIDLNGGIHSFTKNDCEFEYRKSIFQSNNYIIVEASFKCSTLVDELTLLDFRKRNETQPIGAKNCGSVFKNGYIRSWKIVKYIESIREQNYFSLKHKNFYDNSRKESGSIIIDRMIQIKNDANTYLNLNLDFEVKFI